MVAPRRLTQTAIRWWRSVFPRILGTVIAIDVGLGLFPCSCTVALILQRLNQLSLPMGLPRDSDRHL